MCLKENQVICHDTTRRKTRFLDRFCTLRKPANGKFISKEAVVSPGGKVTLVCNDGYTISGSKSAKLQLICTKNGMLSPQSTCQKSKLTTGFFYC